MKNLEYYRGREQTFLKHFFLERYLEKVAYHIGYSANEFVYVDGFSGPWRSRDEKYGDTSFSIAIEKLRQIRIRFLQSGKDVKVRCIFVEKDVAAFDELKRMIADVSDIRVEALQGEFEDRLSDVVRFVGSSFGLVFIDPTGWTGFALDKIAPVLKLRGEVIVNFMYDDINRHIQDVRPEIVQTFSPLFGQPDWVDRLEQLVETGSPREDAIVQLYTEGLCAAGGFTYATSTRILKPLADRTYFHLVYGTRHWKGLVEFRNVERKFVDEQERIRGGVKYEHELKRTGQADLFAKDLKTLGYPRSYEQERAGRCDRALTMLQQLVSQKDGVLYELVLAKLLQLPLVWESDVKGWLVGMHKRGEIEIRGMKPREWTPKPGYVIVKRSH